MRKLTVFLALMLFSLALSTTDYLNPLYPVYASEPTSTQNTATSKPSYAPSITARRLEEEKIRMASKEAEMRMKLDDRKEKIASEIGKFRDKMASREATLRAKLALFKDKLKAGAVEKINSSLGTVHTNRTEMMKKHLEQLSKVLDTIETRVNEMAAKGTSVDAAKSAIASARTALSDANKAVDAEKEKDYTIEVTSETTVKTDAKLSRDSLLGDLKNTYQLVQKAKQAVIDALKAAKEAAGVGASTSPAASV